MIFTAVSEINKIWCVFVIYHRYKVSSGCRGVVRKARGIGCTRLIRFLFFSHICYYLYCLVNSRRTRHSKAGDTRYIIVTKGKKRPLPASNPTILLVADSRQRFCASRRPYYLTHSNHRRGFGERQCCVSPNYIVKEIEGMS